MSIEIWWRAFYEAEGRLTNEGIYDQREIERIAIEEADEALDWAAGSEDECRATREDEEGGE